VYHSKQGVRDATGLYANRAFLIDRLRAEYGFRGYVISDGDAVRYLRTKRREAEGTLVVPRPGEVLYRLQAAQPA
jgi:hypothetical protein